jgi:hypothetical protein
VAPIRTKPRCSRVRGAEPLFVNPLRTSADGDPDNLGGSQSSFGGQSCTPYCVRDELPPTTPDCCVEPIPIISSLTCASGRNQSTPYALFSTNPPRRSFQLLALLSSRGFVDQGQVNVTLPQSIHQLNPPVEFFPMANLLRRFA